ncbi:MAG: caspase family protein [Desulfobacterales bacterium]|nr:caspase family protein [Desulfobacterales bacterium]
MKRIFMIYLGIVLMFFGSLEIVYSQNSKGIEIKSKTVTERRIALVIGNANYKYTSPLKNPINDASDMAKVLKSLNFQVILKLDVKLDDMANSIYEFGEKLRGGGVALFYYSGHGMQVKGENYLIPIDSNLQREDEIKRKTINANDILEKMDEAKTHLNLVFLDACRNNPFPSSTRAVSRGLAEMRAPTGTLLVYATNPGNIASDGTERNGIYTKHLIRYIQKPLEVGMMLRKIRTDVKEETSGQQVPWESGSIEGEFYFVPENTSSSISTSSYDTTSSYITSSSYLTSSSYVTTSIIAYDSKTLWREKDTLYYIYIEGKQVAPETISEWHDNDLLVYYTTLRKYYLLEDYKNRNDDQLRPARVVETPNGTLWSNKEGLYYIYIEGKQVASETISEWHDNDLLVYQTTSRRYNLLENYKNRNDNKLRPARVVETPNGTLWRNKEGLYYIYIDGKQVAPETTSEWKDNDLLVYHTTSKKYYLLEDYRNRGDNQLRPAKLVGN